MYKLCIEGCDLHWCRNIFVTVLHWTYRLSLSNIILYKLSAPLDRQCPSSGKVLLCPPNLYLLFLGVVSKPRGAGTWWAGGSGIVSGPGQPLLFSPFSLFIGLGPLGSTCATNSSCRAGFAGQLVRRTATERIVKLGGHRRCNLG